MNQGTLKDKFSVTYVLTQENVRKEGRKEGRMPLRLFCAWADEEPKSRVQAQQRSGMVYVAPSYSQGRDAERVTRRQGWVRGPIRVADYVPYRV